MPTADQIHPHYRRERMTMETDEQYAERMKELDQREAFFKSLTPKGDVYNESDARPGEF